MNRRLILPSVLIILAFAVARAQPAPEPPPESQPGAPGERRETLAQDPDAPAIDQETEASREDRQSEASPGQEDRDALSTDPDAPADDEAADPDASAEDEEAAQSDELADEEEFDFETPAAEDPSVVQQENDTISVDFPDEEIRTILRIVADLYELNLVVPDTLTGRASIKLRNVTWRQVFDVVLSPVGFTYVEEDNIVKVVSLETLNREPPVTEVVILNYARAEELVPTVLPLVNSETGGRIQMDQRSNALVITERASRLRRIRDIIADLDRPTAQVMIESKFIETTNRDLKNIGVNWASLNEYGVSAGPFNRNFQERSSRDSRVSRGGENIDVDHMRRGFRQADRIAGEPAGTVGPRRRIVEQPDGTFTTEFEDMGPTSSSSQMFENLTSRLSTAVFSADQMQIFLSALSTLTDSKLVSNPTVVTLNNKEAEILIGERYPLVLPRYNPETGTYEAGEPEFLDLGINLHVTPQVNSAGFISLSVRPKVSSLGGTVSYFGADYPIEVTREAASTVTIKDGYTVAIGGLVEDAIENVTSKVPLLGDIPGIGRLFRHDRKSNDQRNLIIFLTARTLNPDGSSFEEVVDPRMMRAMGLRREDIPGYRPEIEMFPGEGHPSTWRTLEEEAEVEVEMEADDEAEDAELPESAQTPVTPAFPSEPIEPEGGELAPDDQDRLESEEQGEFRLEDEERLEPTEGQEGESLDEDERGEIVPPVTEEEAPAEEPRRRSRWLTPEF